MSIINLKDLLKDSLKSKLALTININPNSFIKVGGNRNRWRAIPSLDQKEFMYDNLIDTIQEYGYDVAEYSFELTQQGVYHLHALLIKDNIGGLGLVDLNLMEIEDIHKMQYRFHKAITKTPPSYEIVSRTFLLKNVYDEEGWRKYINKLKEPTFDDFIPIKNMFLKEDKF